MEIRIPAVGESVHEALLAKWFKQNGEAVKKDEALCEIETDKITLDLNADAGGILSISVPEGTTVKVGAVIGSIAEQAAAAETPAETPAVIPPTAPREGEIRAAVSSPAARREMREQGIAPETVAGTGKGGRITLDDLFARIEEKSRRPAEGMPAEPEQETLAAPASEPSPQPSAAAAPTQTSLTEAPACVRSEEAPEYVAGREERRPMSPIRRRIAERLLAARQQTAMLTSFNEADLSRIKALREKHGEHIRQRHGVALGYMSFFVKACVEALREFPAVNASIDGNDIVYHHYYDIGIAIGAEKGLVVPVLRNADRMRLYQIEQAIAGFVEKIRTNRLAIADLEGGTFSITNGGVFGSMLSTPILNPPQSGILGMHAIQDRPVARDGQVVIRPMMYLALSYDHRIIDGREAVLFLRRVKEYIEEPEELLLEG
ncbi:MAG: 2-oxoglutarate dehydrogenase complex dihydrolipoyllysine-residue succinyltransferase [Deltaproteobacteria bacterium]|nr:2-oxoglutarate dehydrogenase complex dihydrolipoyllysine-residue succinyltransferase [Deltaproteobacteria bacterium]